MVTYNHENFIEKAIEGVLNQKANFKFVIVLSDDFSTDHTPEICRKFADKHSDKIIFKAFNRNVGMVSNWYWNMNRCNEFGAEYIAICEGDDIWIDPLKLQKQVDILDTKQDYTMSCGAVNIIDEKSEFVRKRFSLEKNFEITSNDLLRNNHISTCTVLLRSKSLNFDIIRPGINFLDKFIWLSLLSQGPCYFLNDTLASYRMHSAGIYSSLKEYKKSINRIEDYLKLRQIFPELTRVLKNEIRINVFRGFLSAIKNYKFNLSLKIISFLLK